MYSDQQLAKMNYVLNSSSITERVDSQILAYEKKLAELRELKDLFEKQPDISRAMELMTSGII